MWNKIKKHKYEAILVVVLLAAIFLRFTGIKPGFHPFHNDEGTIRSEAIRFIKNNNFEPYHLEYPALPNYINYFAYKLIFIPLGWIKYFALNSNKILDGLITFPLGKDVYNRIFQLEILGYQDKNVLFWERWVTAFFGVGVVLASYLVGKKLFGKTVGLISAILVCVNYRQVLNSHFGLPDIYNAFFFLLSFWAVLFLREKVNFWRSFLCGVFLGFYLSTKYQIFSFVTLLFVYFEQSLRNYKLKDKISSLFNPYFIVVPIISLLVFLFLNLYLFINLETAVSQLSYLSLKNRAGIMQLMYYPYSYLFKIGIGRVTSFLIIAGILLGFLEERWKLVLLLSAIVPFFYFFTFFSSGGVYTRNFVSVIPFLLILAAYAISKIASFKPRKIFTSAAYIVLAVLVWENLANSLIVVKEYSKPWNFELIADWIKKEIPKGSTIAGHSSVPVPGDMVRITYDRWPWLYFSLEEFQEVGAQYAIANFDQIDSDFYWWMGPLENWNKPVAVMRQSYTALTIDELTDFGVHQEINPWQAPESNFVVAKVPYYSLVSREKVETFSYDKNQPLSTWKSEPIKVEGWSGFDIEYLMKMDPHEPNYKDGLIFIKFYLDKEGALKGENHLAVRLSARDDKPGKWVNKNLLGKVPQGSVYGVLGFMTSNPNAAVYFLDKVELYKAVVLEDLGGVKVRKIKIDENILFPNSHINL